MQRLFHFAADGERRALEDRSSVPDDGWFWLDVCAPDDAEGAHVRVVDSLDSAHQMVAMRMTGRVRSNHIEDDAP